jgi:hypothetical protein
MIPLLSGLGLGLAMASDTPGEQPYPAKVIVGWEDEAKIERPFVRREKDHTVVDLLGYERNIGISVTRVNDGHPIIYRGCGSDRTYVALSVSGKGDGQVITIDRSSILFPSSTPATARVLWFMRNIGLLRRNPAFFGQGLTIGVGESLCLGIPVHTASERIKNQRKIWDDQHEGHISAEHVQYFLPGFLLNLLGLGFSGRLHWEYVDDPGKVLLLPTSVLRHMSASERQYEGRDICLVADSPNLPGGLRIRLDENPVDAVIAQGLLETTNAHVSRITALFKEGVPDYMDGYESMTLMIGKEHSLARIPEGEFNGMFL